ncbi:hypothetical protein [Pimelobacter simplex]|uniref:hypothetical protein n=1 Tax=Nocardioides simplex TaxID=2045 RepID=UPI00214F7FF1|nr:hypothetical protein [Pimelobacter simplex]UUW88771.1 hypothetical protein M0M43_23980 [Pimelobacter simplex]UUW98276.1 hypothetical protein M0M48_12630 [Pimelobacter simplex]
MSRRRAKAPAPTFAPPSGRDSRYGRTPKYRVLLLGLPPALLLIALGALWTLQSWGVIGDDAGSKSLSAVGSIVCGFGVALAYVVIRPRR